LPLKEVSQANKVLNNKGFSYINMRISLLKSYIKCIVYYIYLR